MNEEEISAGESHAQALQEFEMLWRHCGGEFLDQRTLLLVIRIRRRREPIGYQRLHSAKLEPVGDAGRIAKDFGKERLVVAFQEHCVAAAAASDQEVERRARVRSAVD